MSKERQKTADARVRSPMGQRGSPASQPTAKSGGGPTQLQFQLRPPQPLPGPTQGHQTGSGSGKIAMVKKDPLSPVPKRKKTKQRGVSKKRQDASLENQTFLAAYSQRHQLVDNAKKAAKRRGPEERANSRADPERPEGFVEGQPEKVKGIRPLITAATGQYQYHAEYDAREAGELFQEYVHGQNLLKNENWSDRAYDPRAKKIFHLVLALTRGERAVVEAATLGEYFRLLITLMFGMKAREIHTVSKSLDHVSCKTNGKVVLEQKGMFRWGRLPPEHRVLQRIQMEILEQLGLDTSLTYQEGSCYQHRQLLEKLRRDIEKLVRNLTEGNQLGLEQTWLTTRVLQRPLWKWLQVLPNLFHNVAALDMFHSELIRLRGELPYTKLCFRNLGDKPHSVIWPDWLTEYLQQGHFATVEFSYCTREGAPMREDRRLLLSNTKIYCLQPAKIGPFQVIRKTLAEETRGGTESDQGWYFYDAKRAPKGDPFRLLRYNKRGYYSTAKKGQEEKKEQVAYQKKRHQKDEARGQRSTVHYEKGQSLENTAKELLSSASLLEEISEGMGVGPPKSQRKAEERRVRDGLALLQLVQQIKNPRACGWERYPDAQLTNRKIKVYERTCQLFQLKSSKKAEEIVGKGVAYLANEIWRVDVWGQNLEVFTLSTAKRVKSCIQVQAPATALRRVTGFLPGEGRRKNIPELEKLMALLQDQFLEISAKMVHGNYEANMFLIVLFLKKTENLGGEEEANLLLRLCPNLKEETGRKAREKTAFSWCPISTHCNGEKETSICAHRDDFDHSPHLSELAGFMKSGAYQDARKEALRGEAPFEVDPVQDLKGNLKTYICLHNNLEQYEELVKAAVREEALKATEMFSHGGGQDIVTKVLVEASATRQAELYRRAFLFDALVRVHREMSDLYRQAQGVLQEATQILRLGNLRGSNAHEAVTFAYKLKQTGEVGMVRESPQGERREVTNELLTLTAQKLDKCSQKGRDLAMIFKVVLAGFWKLLKVEKSKRNLQQEEECFPKDKGWCFNCDREVLTEECVKTCALRLQKHVDDVHAIRHSIRQHEAKGWLEEIPLREAVDELEGVPAPAGLKFYYDEGGQKRPLSNNFFLAGSVGGEKKDRRLILSHKDFTNKILGLGNLVESDWLKATLKALRPDEGVADFIHNLFFQKMARIDQVDLRGAYYQLLIPKELQIYFLARFGGKYYKCTRVFHGFKYASQLLKLWTTLAVGIAAQAHDLLSYPFYREEVAGGTNEDPTFKPEMSAVDNPKDILDRLFAYDFEGIPPSLPALRRTRVQEVLDELRTKPDTVAFEEVYQVVKGDRVSFSDLLAPLLVRLNAGQAKWGNNTRTAHQDNVLIHVHEDDVSVGTQNDFLCASFTAALILVLERAGLEVAIEKCKTNTGEILRVKCQFEGEEKGITLPRHVLEKVRTTISELQAIHKKAVRGRNFELLSQKNRERAEEVLVRLDGSLNYLCGLAEGTKEEWADLSRLLSNAYTTDPRTNDQLTSVGVRHVSSLDLERAALKSSSQVLQLQRKGLKLLRTFLQDLQNKRFGTEEEAEVETEAALLFTDASQTAIGVTVVEELGPKSQRIVNLVKNDYGGQWTPHTFQLLLYNIAEDEEIKVLHLAQDNLFCLKVVLHAVHVEWEDYVKESELYRLRPFKQLDTAERRRQAHVHCQRVSAFLDQFAREAIGLMFAIIITMPYLKNVVILVDALSVADMWDFPQRSRHPIARVMAKVKEVAQQAGMHIFIHWICGAANLADLASRVPEFVTLAAKELFLAHFGVQQEAGAHLKLREQFLPDVMERATDLRVVTTTTGAEPEETERVTELRTATRIVQRMQAQKELEWYAASIKTHLPVEQFLYNRLLHDGLLEQEHFETAEGARDGTLVKLTGVDLTQRYRLFRRVTRARTFFTTNKRTLGAQLQSVVEYAGELKRERATSPGERPDKGHKLCTGMIEYFMYAKQRRINRSAIPWPAEIVRYRQYKNNKTASEEESKRLVGALSVLNEDLLKCRSLKGMPWKGVDLQERANNLKTQALAEAYRDLERANAAWSKDKRTLVATGYSEKPVTTHVTVIITCTLRLAANEIFGLVQEPSRKENPTRAEALQAHVVEYSCAQKLINVYIEICLTAEDIEILNFLAAAVGDRLSTFFEEAPKGYAPNLVLTEIMKKKQLFTHFGKYIRGEKAGMELAKVYTTYIRLYASLPEQSKGRAVLAKIITFFQALVTQDRIAATMLQVGEDLRNSFLSQETQTRPQGLFYGKGQTLEPSFFLDLFNLLKGEKESVGKLFGKITHETDLNKRASEEAIERVASRCSRRYKKANMTAMAQAKEFVGCHLEDGDSDFGENFSEPLKAAVFFEGRLQDHDVSKAEAYELLVALVKSIQHHHSTGSSVSRLFRADPRLCERDVPPMTMAKKFTEDKTLERAWWSHLSEIATDESTPPQGSEENFQEEEAEERELDLAQRQDPESRKTPAEIKLESGGVVKQLDYPPQGFFSGESGSWRLEEEQRIEALLRQKGEREVFALLCRIDTETDFNRLRHSDLRQRITQLAKKCLQEFPKESATQRPASPSRREPAAASGEHKEEQDL